MEDSRQSSIMRTTHTQLMRTEAAEASQLIPLLKTPQAAVALGVGKRTLQELVAERKIGCVRIGRSVRFHPDDLAAYIASVRQKAIGWKGM